MAEVDSNVRRLATSGKAKLKRLAIKNTPNSNPNLEVRNQYTTDLNALHSNEEDVTHPSYYGPGLTK